MSLLMTSLFNKKPTYDLNADVDNTVGKFVGKGTDQFGTKVVYDTRPKYRFATDEEIEKAKNNLGLKVANAAMGALGGGLGGPKGMILGAATAILNGVPGDWKESLENKMRSEPTEPIFENMTEEEIGQYYGRP